MTPRKKAFAYSVEILFPYNIPDDKSHEACFTALQIAIATRPVEMFNLGDDGLIQTKPNGDRFLITLQD